MVSRRLFTIALVAACALSAAAGGGAVLVTVERGPIGPRGYEGPPGPDSSEALDRAVEVEWELGKVERQVEDIDSRVSEIEFDVPLNLSSELSSLGSSTRAICSALDLYC